MSRTTLHQLATFGAPAQFVFLVEWVMTVARPIRDLHMFELFCGEGALWQAGKLRGMTVTGMDKSVNKQDDLLSSHGFLRAIKNILRLRRHALFWAGIPCSTFVWINRGTSKRSRECPLGCVDAPSAHAANVMTSRWCLLVLLTVARQACWLVEQPASSLLPCHPRVADIVEMGRAGVMPLVSLTRFWMKNYGHFTFKPSFVLGDACATCLV
jgi:hypothetical protein